MVVTLGGEVGYFLDGGKEEADWKPRSFWGLGFCFVTGMLQRYYDEIKGTVPSQNVLSKQNKN